MSSRADAHVHLFAGGFRGKSFASRPGVSIDEVACYDSLAQEHDITAALVVGYTGEIWCKDNNEHLAGLSPNHDWIRSLASESRGGMGHALSGIAGRERPLLPRF